MADDALVPPRPVVVFIGAPGSGKSRIGKRVARLLEVPFVDTDKRIVAAHGPITEIFETHGEPHFRILEREQVALALTEAGVVSLGGGAVLHPDTQADLALQLVVQLTVDEHSIAGRNLGSKRPLLAAGGLNAWRDLVAARAPIYDRLATHTVDTSAIPAERVAEQIAAWVRAATPESDAK